MPVIAAFALVGALVGLWLPVFDSASIWPLAALLLALPMWWLGGIPVLAGCAALTISSLHCHWYLASQLPVALVKQDILLKGEIADFPRVTENLISFVLATDAGELRGNYLLRIYGNSPVPQIGERWQFKVRLKLPQGRANRSGFDRDNWYLSHRIHGVGYVRQGSLNRRATESPPPAPAVRGRKLVRAALESVLPTDQVRALLLATVVGGRDAIDMNTWQVLRHTGTTHLMAISGMHVGLVAAFAWLPGRLLGWWLVVCGLARDPLLAARYLAVFSAASYALLSGGSVPTYRALIMVVLVALVSGWRRRIPLRILLSLAMLVFLLGDPVAVIAPGFWLSFAAVALLASMVTVKPRSTRALSFTSLGENLAAGFKRLLRMQYVLGVGLALPLGLMFGNVSVVTLVANSFAVPLFSFGVLPLALAGAGLAALGLPGGEGGLHLAAWLLGFLFKWLTVLADSTFAVFELGRLSAVTLAVAVFGVLLVLLPRPLPGKVLGCCCLLFGLTRNAPVAIDQLKIRVLDVGQGLAVIVQTPGYALLYDAGASWPGGDAGSAVVLPVLRGLGIRKLDALMVSHSDNDHSGGVTSILNGIAVHKLIGAYPDDNGRDTAACRAGLKWRWDNVVFRVIHPSESGYWTGNNSSCVLLVETGGSSILLPGDIEKPVEKYLLNGGMLSGVDIVIAPHHGSRTSSSPGFVTKLGASFVVFSAGYANRWRFPTEEIVGRWLASGTCVLSTAQFGAIEFDATTGGGFRVSRLERASLSRPWALRRASSVTCPGTINRRGSEL